MATRHGEAPLGGSGDMFPQKKILKKGSKMEASEAFPLIELYKAKKRTLKVLFKLVNFQVLTLYI